MSTQINKTRRQILGHTFYGTAALFLSQLLFQRNLAMAASKANRIIFVYHPDGVVPHRWHTDAVNNLSESLKPLSPFREHLTLFRGLNLHDPRPGSHPEGVDRLLTGTHNASASIDVVLAEALSGQVLYPHIHLGVESNASEGRDRKISRFHGGIAKPAEDDLGRSFQQFFGQSPRNIQDPDYKLLKQSQKDLESLKTKLGSIEAKKLDQHISTVNAMIKRKQGNEAPNNPNPDRPGLCQNPVGPNGRESTLAEKIQRQMLTIVDAMACGLSHVATLQISHHTSERIVETGEGSMRSHEASHNNADVHTKQKILFNQQIAFLANQLKSRKDPLGSGSMLDHTIVCVITEVANGATHTHEDLPFYLLGGKGVINSGTVIDCRGKTTGSLWASLATSLGVPMNGFGDGAGLIDGLLV
ncbi:MAG: DUF1552 domain-containing protein [Pseudobacteriovorax sp.]|nr:DUF1552 domain-containing protein [Pseudobacteriovorax sp.]